MMKLIWILLVVPLLQGCSVYDNVYIRNMLEETAIIDVFFHETKGLRRLPNQVLSAERIVKFKSGYQQHFNLPIEGEWKTTSHFRIKVPAHHTIFVNDFAGRVMNSSIYSKIVVLASASAFTDTIYDYRSKLLHEKFSYFGRFASSPIFYYDIKPRD